MRADCKKCLLAIVLIVLAVELSFVSRVNASYAVAIIVFDHGLTKQVSWVGRGNIKLNKTSSFTQDDRLVWAYLTAEVSSANVTWLWYDPEGDLYRNEPKLIQCDVSPCSFVSVLPLAHTDASSLFGLWTVTLQAGGVNLYSDHFSVTKVVLQDDYWKFVILQSAPARVHGELMVTVHPSNQTWSSYVVYMPFAANITAFEDISNRTLNVNVFNSTHRVVVNLGAPRFDGYRFMLNFDVLYGVTSLGGWGTGNFAFTWQEWSWGNFGDGFHSIPGSFDVTLPEGAVLVDTVGINTVTLNQTVTSGSKPTVGIVATLSPQRLRFGWTIIYRDFTYRNSHSNSPSTPVSGGLNAVLLQRIPVLPLTLGSFSLWTAVMSVFLLTASEFMSAIYARTGILINRRRLRIAAMLLVAIFVVTIAYQLILSQSIAAQVTH